MSNSFWLQNKESEREKGEKDSKNNLKEYSLYVSLVIYMMDSVMMACL